MIAFILLVIGGLNWGLFAFDFNLVSYIFGSVAWLEQLVYILVSLSALLEIFTHKANCKHCGSKSAGTM